MEHVLEFGSNEGKEFVDEVIQDSVPFWDDLVEGKFLTLHLTWQKFTLL